MIRTVLKSLALTAILAASTQAQAASVYVYLGGALNTEHCRQMAYSAGFSHYSMGGLVNGIYYWNACFGINQDRPLPPPGPDYEDIASRTRQLSISARLLSIEVYQTAGYSNDARLREDLDQLTDSIDRLLDAVEDHQSVRLLERRFERVSQTFLEMEQSFLDVHSIYRNRDLGHGFDEVEETYVALDGLL